MLFLDRGLNVFHKLYYDQHDAEFSELNSDILHHFSGVFSVEDVYEEVAGICEFKDGVYFVASTFVTDSLGEKEPNGRFIVGRKIDDEIIEALEGISDYKITSLFTSPASAEDEGISSIKNYFEYTDETTFDVVIPTAHDATVAAVFSVSKPRTFYQSGIAEFKKYVFFAVLVVCALFVLIYLLLGNIISKPLMCLIREVKSIDLTWQNIKRIRNTGKGELAFLRSSINTMLEKIETEQKQLKSSEEKLYATLLSVGDGVIAADREGIIEFINPVTEKLTGWSISDARGKPIETVFNIINEYTREKVTSPVAEVFEKEQIVELANHTLLISKDGREVPIEDTASPIRDKDNNIVGCVLVFRDFSEKKEKQRWIEFLSYHDQLSGLYNRRFFEEELLRLDTKRNLPISLVFADVNGLKTINDAFGHHVGDQLINKVADVFLAECRADDIISRTGGDEFVIILPNTDSVSSEKLIKRIKSKIEKQKIMNINISISFGWDTKQSEAQSVWDVLKNAENYMYKKKTFDNASRRSSVVKSILGTLRIKSPYEDAHSKRVSELCESFGKALKLESDEIAELRAAGELHDIGKVAVDEKILSDAEELTDSGWAQMKSHPEIGYRLLSNTNEFYNIAEYIAAHHERWDGTGYPKGIRGESIHFKARIIAIADAFDAMTSERPYKNALPEDEAVSEMRKNAGTQFDPELARVFVEKVLGKEWIT